MYWFYEFMCKTILIIILPINIDKINIFIRWNLRVQYLGFLIYWCRLIQGECTKTIYKTKREWTECVKNTCAKRIGAHWWSEAGVRCDVWIIIKMNWTKKLIDETRTPGRDFVKGGEERALHARNEERWHA